MHYFGLGLMNKTFDYFNKKAKVDIEEIIKDGTEMRFIKKEYLINS